MPLMTLIAKFGFFILGFFSRLFFSFPILIDLFLRSTEHDHVKDNLPAKLLHIRTFGKMKLHDFKDLISHVDYKMCESKMNKNLILS